MKIRKKRERSAEHEEQTAERPVEGEHLVDQAAALFFQDGRDSAYVRADKLVETEQFKKDLKRLFELEEKARTR